MEPPGVVEGPPGVVVGPPGVTAGWPGPGVVAGPGVSAGLPAGVVAGVSTGLPAGVAAGVSAGLPGGGEATTGEGELMAEGEGRAKEELSQERGGTLSGEGIPVALGSWTGLLAATATLVSLRMMSQ